ncbi:MAG: TFIIB-type zinc ribbon-containing protein [Clostridia bacterium]|nr:TFIIB-type zinc ribbon-containing protein [Clostridia bacterium]
MRDDFTKKLNDVMKLNEYLRMKHADRYCPICKTSAYSLFDENRGETFCAKCGLVLHESHKRKSVVKQIKEAKIKEEKFKTYLKSKLK